MTRIRSVLLGSRRGVVVSATAVTTVLLAAVAANGGSRPGPGRSDHRAGVLRGTGEQDEAASAHPSEIGAPARCLGTLGVWSDFCLIVGSRSLAGVNSETQK